MKDKISIIIPVYNTAELLDQCLESVCNQTYPNLEIIIVDDGSTDDSFLVCQRWAEKDSRIILLHKENEGQSVARNLALDMVTGDYIGFVDSDDYIEPDMYEVMLKAIIDSGADVAQCKIGNELWGEGPMYEQLLRDTIGSQLVKFLFRAELWKTIRLPMGRYAEDAAVVPVLLYNRKLMLVDRSLYNYYSDNPSSSSNAQGKRLKNAIDRAIVFAERYIWMRDKEIDKETQWIILGKSTSFFIGALGIYTEKQHPQYKNDVLWLVSFARHNYWGILRNRYLSFARKVAITIICVAPVFYYTIRNFVGER